MARISDSGKAINFEVSAFYRPKDDSIHVISADPYAGVADFHVSVAKGTETENALRTELIRYGLIDLQRLSDTVYRRGDLRGNTWDTIPVGELLDGTEVNLELVHGLTVVGRPGGGRSNFLKNLIFHAAQYPDVYQAVGIGFDDDTLLDTRDNTDVVLGSATTYLDALAITQTIRNIVVERANSGYNKHAFIGKDDDKAILFFIENVDHFLAEEDDLAEDILYISEHGPVVGVFPISTLTRVDGSGVLPASTFDDIVVTVGGINATDSKAAFGEKAETVNLRNKVGESWVLQPDHTDYGDLADANGNAVWDINVANFGATRFFNYLVTKTSWNQLG